MKTLQRGVETKVVDLRRNFFATFFFFFFFPRSCARSITFAQCCSVQDISALPSTGHSH